MPTRGSKEPNGRALRGRRAHTTFISDPIAQLWSNYNIRSGVDEAITPEQPAVQNCLYDRFEAIYKKTSIKPSLLIIPARFKSGKLYSQIPTSGAGDFTVTRSTTATRVNASGLTESVASGIPRLDYFASDGTVGCPSLLVEPSAQNLALQSENFATTWSPVQFLAFGSGSVLNTTATLDPYGTNVADLIVANTVSGTQHRVDQTTVSVSGSYTFSVFLKTAGYGFARLRIGGQGAIFNLSTGVVIGTDAGITSSIQSFGNGWYRCIIGKAASAANEIIRINMQPTASTADFAGDGTSGIYVFGAQYETGSVATSYIPTTTAAVTRNADVVSVSGAVSGAIGQTSGTFYLDISYAYRGLSTPNRWLEISSASNNIGLANAGADVVRSSVNAQSDILSLTPSTASGLKIAWGYDGSGVVLFVNGTQYTLTNGGAQVITSLDKVLIDMSSAIGLRMAYARIRAISCYQTRLTNEQLQFLTS